MDTDTETKRAEQRRMALATTAKLIAEAQRDVVHFVIRLLPGLVRVLIIGATAVFLVEGTLGAWQAFGADPIAVVPALALALVPMQFAFIPTVHYGGMLAAGGFTYGTSRVLLAMPAEIVQLSAVVVLAAITFMEMSRRGKPQALPAIDAEEVQP